MRRRDQFLDALAHPIVAAQGLLLVAAWRGETGRSERPDGVTLMRRTRQRMSRGGTVSTAVERGRARAFLHSARSSRSPTPLLVPTRLDLRSLAGVGEGCCCCRRDWCGPSPRGSWGGRRRCSEQRLAGLLQLSVSVAARACAQRAATSSAWTSFQRSSHPQCSLKESASIC